MTVQRRLEGRLQGLATGVGPEDKEPRIRSSERSEKIESKNMIVVRVTEKDI
jgi:hypothetical protein